MSPHSSTSYLVPTKVAAARLGITVDKLNELARKGLIPRYSLGHRTHRYDLREVLDALHGGAGGSSSGSSSEQQPAASSLDRIAGSVVGRLAKP